MIKATNFDFWKMAYDMGAIDVDMLRQAVKTDANPYGEISKDEFKTICGQDFDPVKEETKDDSKTDEPKQDETTKTEQTTTGGATTETLVQQ